MEKRRIIWGPEEEAKLPKSLQKSNSIQRSDGTPSGDVEDVLLECDVMVEVIALVEWLINHEKNVQRRLALKQELRAERFALEKLKELLGEKRR